MFLCSISRLIQCLKVSDARCFIILIYWWELKLKNISIHGKMGFWFCKKDNVTEEEEKDFELTDFWDKNSFAKAITQQKRVYKLKYTTFQQFYFSKTSQLISDNMSCMYCFREIHDREIKNKKLFYVNKKLPHPINFST